MKVVVGEGRNMDNANTLIEYDESIKKTALLAAKHHS
jgi:hypothetical protein